MSNNKKQQPTVKHVPLKRAEKFWETIPTQSNPSSDANLDELELKELFVKVIDRLDKIIDKLEK
jgi:hypothetical protein